jgi:hypothetical protein
VGGRQGPQGGARLTAVLTQESAASAKGHVASVQRLGGYSEVKATSPSDRRPGVTTVA